MCSNAGISSWATNTKLHTLHFFPSVKPVLPQLASTLANTSSVWPNAGISCWGDNSILQTLQWLPAVNPGKVQVGSTAMSTTSLCDGKITSCGFNNSLHTPQWLPSVKPLTVQVASTLGSTTTVWPNAGISTTSSITKSHSLQYAPAEWPAFVHVAS